jgi:hypothetical protein
MNHLHRQFLAVSGFLLAAVLGLSSHAMAADAIVPTPCDKELSVGDASGILKGTPRINRYSMSGRLPGEGCELGVGDGNPAIAMIDIAVKDRAANYISMMKQIGGKNLKALKGVGDEAYDKGSYESNIPDATEIEIYARKGDWLCVAELHRTNGVAGDSLLVTTDAGAISEKLGALCQKIFIVRKY